MDWLIAAPFSATPNDQWLGAYVPGDRHRFASVVAGYVHDRSRRQTSKTEWIDYFGHAWRTSRAAQKAEKRTGIITCFPQLALAAGFCDMASIAKVPTIAWTFNVGNLVSGWRQRIVRASFDRIHLFIVHSRAEVATYSRWLDLPPERFRFVPLELGRINRQRQEDRDSPYLLAMGSAHRDYASLMAALSVLGYRSIVVCAPHALEGIHVPPCVEVMSNLSIDRCHDLLQGARLSVIPLVNSSTASGQVTLLDAMALACPTVATACPGTLDYATSGHDSLLVPIDDRDAMRDAIQQIWENEQLRETIGRNAKERCDRDYSNAAIGRIMSSILDEVEDSVSRTS